MFVCKIFRANLFVWRNNQQILIYACQYHKFQQQYDTLNHAQLTNTKLELTENLELSLFRVYHKMDL